MNRRIVLASRPTGEPKESDFRMETVTLPPLQAGEVLLRTHYFSLDPYMRGRMNDGPSYAAPTAIGDVMPASSVCEVMESQASALRPGDVVAGFTGWQEFAVAKALGLRKLDPSGVPLSWHLGVLGMPGLTAYAGLLNIGAPKAGETVAVAAASGAVGSLVGQIAKIRGCRAVGIAGGPQKCAYVVDELGFDACVDHRSATFAADLKAACPAGIDVYFENVGGPVFEAVLPLLNNFARVPVCGLISQYNATALPSGPDRSNALLGAILVRRLLFRGFIVSDFIHQQAEFAKTMGGWLQEGRVRYREDIVDGLENAVAAFQGLLQGRNFGKLVVRLVR